MYICIYIGAYRDNVFMVEDVYGLGFCLRMLEHQLCKVEPRNGRKEGRWAPSALSTSWSLQKKHILFWSMMLMWHNSGSLRTSGKQICWSREWLGIVWKQGS